MARAFLLLMTVATLARPDARIGSLDPAFNTIPFDRWFDETKQTRFKWSARVFSTGLSNHQRLGARVDVELDGAELVKRRGKGEMVLFIQFQDRQGHIYQSHRGLPLDDIKDEASHSMVQFIQDAFVLPGDYQVSLGLFASGTGEHVSVRRTLHIDLLTRDPLPDAWRDLPPVEILTAEDGLDTLWIHSIAGRLNLSVDNHRPVRLELLVNQSPTEQATGTRFERITGRNTAALLPVLKTLSQIRLDKGSIHVELLDLSRRRVSFEQDLDSARPSVRWSKLSGALSDSSPHVIDVGSLEKRQENAQFFVSEVKRRITAPAVEPVCAVIVLSGPVAFEKGENLTPIVVEDKPGCSIFYIRYSTVLFRPGGGQSMNPGPMARTEPRPMSNVPSPVGITLPDSLARTLKPLDPHLFDVATPAECRRALAAILAEISRSAN